MTCIQKSCVLFVSAYCIIQVVAAASHTNLKADRNIQNPASIELAPLHRPHEYQTGTPHGGTSQNGQSSTNARSCSKYVNRVSRICPGCPKPIKRFFQKYYGEQNSWKITDEKTNFFADQDMHYSWILQIAAAFLVYALPGVVLFFLSFWSAAISKDATQGSALFLLGAEARSILQVLMYAYFGLVLVFFKVVCSGGLNDKYSTAALFIFSVAFGLGVAGSVFLPEYEKVYGKDDANGTVSGYVLKNNSTFGGIQMSCRYSYDGVLDAIAPFGERCPSDARSPSSCGYKRCHKNEARKIYLNSLYFRYIFVKKNCV